MLVRFASGRERERERDSDFFFCKKGYCCVANDTWENLDWRPTEKSVGADPTPDMGNGYRDMRNRHKLGMERYGKPLLPNDDIDKLQNAYEALDPL